MELRISVFGASLRPVMTATPWLRRVLIGLPFLWLAVFFLAPLLIVAGISLTESADAIPPFEPPLAFGPEGIRKQFDRRELPAARRRLPQNLRALGRLCRVHDAAVPPDRISDGAGDRPRARELAHAAAVSGNPAVLDQFPDPGLCLDRAVAAERPDQPRCCLRPG